MDVTFKKIITLKRIGMGIIFFQYYDTHPQLSGILILIFVLHYLSED